MDRPPANSSTLCPGAGVTEGGEGRQGQRTKSSLALCLMFNLTWLESEGEEGRQGHRDRGSTGETFWCHSFLTGQHRPWLEPEGEEGGTS